MTTWTDEMTATLKRMRKDGESYSAIARRLKVSRNAAIGKGARLGLETGQRQFVRPVRRDLPTPDRQRDMRDLAILDALVDGHRPGDVALSFNVMPEYVRDLWDAREAAR